MQFEQRLIGVVPLGALRHNANSLALTIAQRVDRCTTENLVYSTMTDGGSNVLCAARRLLQDFEGALATDDRTLADVWGVVAVDDVAGDDDLVDDDADDARRRPGDSDDGDDLDDLEMAREGRCIDHLLNLAVGDMIKSCTLDSLLADVGSVINAVRRSTMRQQQLQHLQRIAAPNALPRALIRRVATRWHSAHDAVQRFLELHVCLRTMYAKGAFVKSKTTVRMPTIDARPTLEAFVEVLGQIKVAMKLCEVDGHMLSHIPLVVSSLFVALDPPIGAARDNETHVKSRIREAARRAVETRARKFIDDAAQPALLAAVLDPRYGVRVRQFGVTKETFKEINAHLLRWIVEMQPAAAAGVGASIDDDDDEVDDFVAHLPRMPIATPTSVLQSTLGQYLKHTSTLAHQAEFPLPEQSSAGLSADATTAVLQRCFVNDKRWSALAPLVRLLFSMPASSASAERAFSASGRICSPLRARLSACSVEQMTVIHQHIVKSGVSTSVLTNQIVEYLSEKR